MSFGLELFFSLLKILILWETNKHFHSSLSFFTHSHPHLLFLFTPQLVVCNTTHIQKRKKMEEEETPNEETKKLFDSVEKGAEELVRVLLLGKENKQFKLDLNFQFKDQVFFFNSRHFSLVSSFLFFLFRFFFLSLSLVFFAFIFFPTSFCSVWRDHRSSQSCFQRI